MKRASATGPSEVEFDLLWKGTDARSWKRIVIGLAVFLLSLVGLLTLFVFWFRQHGVGMGGMTAYSSLALCLSVTAGIVAGGKFVQPMAPLPRLRLSKTHIRLTTDTRGGVHALRSPFVVGEFENHDLQVTKEAFSHMEVSTDRGQTFVVTKIARRLRLGASDGGARQFFGTPAYFVVEEGQLRAYRRRKYAHPVRLV